MTVVLSDNLGSLDTLTGLTLRCCVLASTRSRFGLSVTLCILTGFLFGKYDTSDVFGPTL